MRAIAMALPWLLFSSWIGAQELPCRSDGAAISAHFEAALLLDPVAATPTLARRQGAPATGLLAGAFDAPAPIAPTALAAAPIGDCVQLAARRDKRKAAASSRGGADGAGYKPKTRYDNTPWRFNMEQNGKRMTADEFDAWMKAKGVRVATGAPAPVRKEDKRRRIAHER